MLTQHEVDDVLRRQHTAVCSLKGNKSTAPNQDRAICASLGMGAMEFLGVFDGHGEQGHLAAELCNEVLPKLLLRAMVRADLEIAATSGDPNPQDAAESAAGWQEAACHAFTEAHGVLEELTVQYLNKSASSSDTSSSLLDARASGTTATLIALAPGRVLVAHTGDSRAVLGVRPRGSGARWRLVELTQDHKPELPNEEARVEQAGARVLRSGHPPNEVSRIYTPQQTWPMINMTRSLGDLHAHTQGLSAEAEVLVAERLWDASEEAVMLVCSDGIWDVFSSLEAVELVAELSGGGLDPASGLALEAYSRWMQRCLPGEYSDDITVIVRFL